MILPEQHDSASNHAYNPEKSQDLFKRRFLGGCGSTIVFLASAAALVGEILIPGAKQLSGEVAVIATSGVVFLSGAITAASAIGLRKLYKEYACRIKDDNNRNNMPVSGVLQS